MPVGTLSPREREGAAQPRKGEGEQLRHYRSQPSGTIDRARQLRRNATEVEKRLWSALRERLPKAKWRRQMPVGPYFVDFACFAERLVIELDGSQHAEADEYDLVRTNFIERDGYRVLRFWNHDVMDNLDGVLEVIAATVSPSPSQPLAGPLPLPSGEGI
jgi:very-short-patch-repair endonuclease